MACPCFEPVEPLAGVDWIHAPRLPLIDLYRGICRAGEPFEPDESIQREICNWGYPRGRCGRFPAGSPDAVRFSVAEDAGTLRIIYVFEKDGAPESSGIVDCSALSGAGILEKQIGAFAESYRRRVDHFQSSRGGENTSIATASSSTTAE